MARGAGSQGPRVPAPADDAVRPIHQLIVVLAVIASVAGLLALSLRADLDVRRSINPHLRRYAFGFILLTAGLVLLIYSVPCRQLSAWTIGAGVMVFSVGSTIWGLSWGHLVPELRRVVTGMGLIIVTTTVLAVVRPDC